MEEEKGKREVGDRKREEEEEETKNLGGDGGVGKS